MGRRRGVLAGLALLAVGACSATPGLSSTSSLQQRVGPDGFAASIVGRCLGGERLADDEDALAGAIAAYGLDAYQAMGDDPVWTDAVACAEPHTLEVYATVAVPRPLAEQVADYADLLAVDGPRAAALDAEVARACAAEVPVASRVAAAAPLDVDVLPYTAPAVGRFSWSPAPPAAWDDGERVFACLFEQPQPASHTVADVVGGGLPAADRVCLRGTAFTSCARTHDVERLALLGVDRAVGRGELAGARAVDDLGRVLLAPGQWRLLDATCERYLRAVAAHPWPGIRGVADTYPELYPDDAGNYTVLCLARSPFETPTAQLIVTTGSVYDGGGRD